MKAIFSISVIGSSQLKDDLEWTNQNTKFGFKVEKATSRIELLTIEISQVGRDRWPILVETTLKPSDDGLPVFPFEFQPNALSLNDIRDNLIKLESALSVTHDFRLDWTSVKMRWEREDADVEYVGMMPSYEQTAREHEPQFIDVQTLVFSVALAAREDEELLALSHFQYAMMHKDRGNHLDCIRHGFFFLEQLFAPGQFKTKKIIAAFKLARELQLAAESWIVKNKKRFEALKSKYKSKEFGENNYDELLNCIVELRGLTQHAQKHGPRFWMSAKQFEYESEANMLAEITSTIALGIRQRHFASIYEDWEKTQKSDS